MTIVLRIASITSEVVPILWSYIRDYRLHPLFASIQSPSIPTQQTQNQSAVSSTTAETETAIALQRKHAIELRSSLTRLGPAFIKFGQQLSIRPDILPHAVLKELQALCDNVQPAPFCETMQILREDFSGGSGGSTNEDDDQSMEYLNRYLVVDEMTLVASASLGQVYRTRLRRRRGSSSKSSIDDNREDRNDDSGEDEWVAMKIQRPDMVEKVSLDLYLLNQYGTFLDWMFGYLTEQVPFHVDFIDCFARGSYLVSKLSLRWLQSSLPFLIVLSMRISMILLFIMHEEIRIVFDSFICTWAMILGTFCLSDVYN